MLIYLPEKLTLAEGISRITMREEEDGHHIALFREHDQYVPLALLPAVFTREEAEKVIENIALAVSKKGTITQISSIALLAELT